MYIRVQKYSKGKKWSVYLVHSQRKQGSTYPYPVVVKRFGVASNQEEIQSLKEQAASWKKEYGSQWNPTSDSIGTQDIDLPNKINPPYA